MSPSHPSPTCMVTPRWKNRAERLIRFFTATVPWESIGESLISQARTVTLPIPHRCGIRCLFNKWDTSPLLFSAVHHSLEEKGLSYTNHPSLPSVLALLQYHPFDIGMLHPPLSSLFLGGRHTLASGNIYPSPLCVGECPCLIAGPPSVSQPLSHATMPGSRRACFDISAGPVPNASGCYPTDIHGATQA